MLTLREFTLFCGSVIPTVKQFAERMVPNGEAEYFETPKYKY